MVKQKHKTKEGDSLTDKQYNEYRADYQASWERERYKTDEDYREYKRQQSKDRYDNMTDKEKSEYLEYLKKYRENKDNNMTAKEKSDQAQARSEYHKKRRDSKIVEDAKIKFESLSDTKKDKYLEKLFRYSRICSEPAIGKQLTKWAAKNYDAEELVEFGFQASGKTEFQFSTKKPAVKKSVSKVSVT